MREILDLLFNSFQYQLPIALEQLFLNEKMHLTNKGALRCFLLGMLANMFRSPTATSHLEMAYISSTSDVIFLFVVNKETTGKKKSNKMQMFIFDLSNDYRKPTMAPRTSENLVAMLIADNFGRFLSEKRFSKAKVISIIESDDSYMVNVSE